MTTTAEAQALPDSIKIGWKQYFVENWPESDARDQNRLGEVDHVKAHIRVTTNVNDAQRAETLLHEILHATMYMWSLDVADLARLRNPEETLVSALASGLSCVLRDNPALLAYLSDVWVGRPEQGGGTAV